VINKFQAGDLIRWNISDRSLAGGEARPEYLDYLYLILKVDHRDDQHRSCSADERIQMILYCAHRKLIFYDYEMLCYELFCRQNSLSE